MTQETLVEKVLFKKVEMALQSPYKIVEYFCVFHRKSFIVFHEGKKIKSIGLFLTGNSTVMKDSLIAELVSGGPTVFQRKLPASSVFVCGETIGLRLRVSL